VKRPGRRNDFGPKAEEYRGMSEKSGPSPGFTKVLLRWYRRYHRNLPWRGTSDPYRIWVSEVMLQQTTVQAVIPYYEKWLTVFPDLASLARAPLRKVLKAWQGLGYYARARNMRRAAQVLIERHDGRFPSRYEELRKLPGFGPYTTAAVLSLVFDKPYPVLDANVRRVAMRLAGMSGEPEAKKDKLLMEHLLGWIPHKKPGLFNQAMMELGALLCRPRSPLCLLCPLSAFCKAYEAGEQEVIPSPKKRNSTEIEAVVGIIRKDGKYLIQKRPSSGLLADLWEFPGGKRKPGETLKQAVRRELREELGVEVAAARPLITVRHAYTRFRVRLHAYDCRLKSDPKTDPKRLRWVSLRALRRYPFPSGSARIVDKLGQCVLKTNSSP
jgi:A/G-specific adenine glycosylase